MNMGHGEKVWMDAIRTVNDGLAFLLEIAALVALVV